MSPTASLSRTEQAIMKRWYGMMMFFEEGQENTELMTEYFFEQFLQSPERFYSFLHFYKKKLKSKRSSKDLQKVAQRYLSILSHLCDRFGFYEENKVLNDLCFRITNPKEYEHIVEVLHEYQLQSKKPIDKILRKLRQLMKESGIVCRVKGRYKNIYSIYKKLQKKPRKHIANLYDIFAFRITVEENNPHLCYDVLSILHDQFYPVACRFKDYIQIPKINGYQSLHTGLKDVIPELKTLIEVQIRTEEMDDVSERGLAAHWFYARQKKSQMPTEKERKLIDYFSSLSRTSDQKDMVFCFSYEGDVFKLPRGSSARDFASRIHSKLAKNARFARVNGTKKTLRYLLKEGDQVEIIADRHPLITTALP